MARMFSLGSNECSRLRWPFNQAALPITREIKARRRLRFGKPEIGEGRDIRSTEPVRLSGLIHCPPTCVLWSLRPIDFHSELIALLGSFVESANHCYATQSSYTFKTVAVMNESSNKADTLEKHVRCKLHPPMWPSVVFTRLCPRLWLLRANSRRQANSEKGVCACRHSFADAPLPVGAGTGGCVSSGAVLLSRYGGEESSPAPSKRNAKHENDRKPHLHRMLRNCSTT